MRIAWYGKHFGEEPPLVGCGGGSGTIFFSGCNLRCVFCQNYQISQEGIGKEYSVDDVRDMMLYLQREGALNINLVTPTIWWEPIKEAVIKAREKGLLLPIVWNSNGYELFNIIKNMEGIVDIYLPDFKYGDDSIGYKYSGIRDYTKLAIPAIKEMFRQVGRLKMDKNRIAKKGLIVRHLIIPSNIENSLKALKIISKIVPETHVSLMTQYSPMHKAAEYPEVNRKITKEEFEEVFDFMANLNMKDGWVQDEESQTVMIPDFSKKNPFQ